MGLDSCNFSSSTNLIIFCQYLLYMSYFCIWFCWFVSDKFYYAGVISIFYFLCFISPFFFPSRKLMMKICWCLSIPERKKCRDTLAEVIVHEGNFMALDLDTDSSTFNVAIRMICVFVDCNSFYLFLYYHKLCDAKGFVLDIWMFNGCKSFCLYYELYSSL